jgi:hypothetical protein
MWKQPYADFARQLAGGVRRGNGHQDHDSYQGTDACKLHSKGNDLIYNMMTFEDERQHVAEQSHVQHVE